MGRANPKVKSFAIPKWSSSQVRRHSSWSFDGVRTVGGKFFGVLLVSTYSGHAACWLVTGAWSTRARTLSSFSRVNFHSNGLAICS